MAIEMVKVKLNCARAGHTFDAHGRQTGDFTQSAGDVVEMGVDEAQRHISRGLASPHREESSKKN